MFAWGGGGGGIFNVLNVKLWLNLLIIYIWNCVYKGLLSLGLQKVVWAALGAR